MNSNSNSFMRVQVRVQKKYFFEFKFKFEFGKIIEFFRVRVRRPGLNHAWSMQLWVNAYDIRKCGGQYIHFKVVGQISEMEVSVDSKI